LEFLDNDVDCKYQPPAAKHLIDFDGAGNIEFNGFERFENA
jgi:hypothetical protein